VKVILLEDVDRLGKMGDIVTVKEGYARNYLLPKNKAKVASVGNMKILEMLKKKREAQEKKVLDEAKALSEKLASLSLTISAEAGEEEKLFGSVSNEMIAEALAAQGITIDKKDIIIDEPIRKLGVYTVAVKVHPEVRASLRVWVIKT